MFPSKAQDLQGPSVSHSSCLNHTPSYFFFFNLHLRTCLLILEKEEEKEREKNTDQLPPIQICALTGNRTGNLLVHRTILQLTEPPGQDSSRFLNISLPPLPHHSVQPHSHPSDLKSKQENPSLTGVEPTHRVLIESPHHGLGYTVGLISCHS